MLTERPALLAGIGAVIKRLKTIRALPEPHRDPPEMIAVLPANRGGLKFRTRLLVSLRPVPC